MNFNDILMHFEKVKNKGDNTYLQTNLKLNNNLA